MTSTHGVSLFRTRRFLPLFIAQFFGAFNDNIFRNALVILITYRLADASGANAQMMVTLAAGLFILPFFLFSATAGQLADKYSKTRLIRLVKGTEILCMALGAAALFSSSIPLLQIALFLMGIQAAFFGPLKYGSLPELMAKEELIAANAFFSTSTFIAILLGTILGGLLVLHPAGLWLVALIITAGSAASWAVTFAIPTLPPANPALKARWNLATESLALLRHTAANKALLLPILGSSWFWFVGSVFLSQFATYTHDMLHADETVVTLFFMLFSVGIGIGAQLCNRLMQGQIHANFVPLGALGMAIFSFDLYAAALAMPYSPELLDLWGFLLQDGSLRIMLDVLLIAIFGGLYNVPLYALLQHRADAKAKAQAIAGNNVYNALFMVIASLFCMGFYALGATAAQLFFILGALNLLALVIACRILPLVLARMSLRGLLRLLFRVEITGLEHYRAAGERVVIIANHTSFLDALLLVSFLPDTLSFAINSNIAKRWWIRPFLKLVDVQRMDPTNPLAMKQLIARAKENRRIVIFPEGRITVTGALMKMYHGPALLADKADAILLPIRIDGPQYSYFSRMKGEWRLSFFPKTRLTILPSVHLTPPPDEVKGRARRIMLGRKLYDVMSDMVFATSDLNEPLYQSLLKAAKRHGYSHIIAEDIRRQPMSYRRLIQRSLALGAKMEQVSRPQEILGILLPNSLAALASFFAAQSVGRVPAMLNFSSGLTNLKSACTAGPIRTIYTARAFIEQAKLEELTAGLHAAGLTIIYLEDLAATIGLPAKLRALFLSHFPSRIPPRATPDQPAVVLFTSGSEGAPKGVVLSHRNLQANRHQAASRLDFGPRDRIFNALPMFHSFGLTVGTLLPVASGIRIFLYPSPLHYRIVPELAYDTRATIFFGTDTFLAGYARYADPYDFRSIRYIFSGAEKMKDSTRAIYMEKYGVRILEGYGATETSPVLSANTPMHNRNGTVGRFFPHITWKLEPVPGIEQGGRLWVKGPNIMMGYLKADRPGHIQPPEDGWYDTGDIVDIDIDGYVHILGRAKRFAKIAGEMVSLTAVEELAQRCWPKAQHAIISIPDVRKGEQLILYTDQHDARRDTLQQFTRSQGAPELWLPRSIEVMRKLPLLPTGKVDYVSLQKQAENQSSIDGSA